MEQKPERKSYEWQVFCPVCKASNCNNNITCIKCDAPLEPTNKPEAPMTWEQLLAKFCEQNFDTSYKKAMREKSPVVMAEIYKAAADFHAREAFNRGAREQREICAENAKLDYERAYRSGDEVAVIDRESIRNAPAPEFKA